MRSLLYFSLFFFIAFTSIGQDKVSLKDINKRFRNSSSDIEKIKVLNEYYVHYYTLDSDSAMYFAQKAYDLSKKANYLEGQIRSATNIGSVNFYKGDLSKALQGYIESNDLTEKYIEQHGEDKFSQRQTSKNLNNIGLIFLNQQDFEEAEKYLLSSIAIDKKLGNRISISNCYHNLGTVKENQGKYDEAIEYYTKAYYIKVEENNILEIPSTLINIGVIRMNEESYHQADTCFQAAVKYSKKSNNSRDLCLAYINLGDLHFLQQEYNRAITKYFQAVDICEENNYLYFLNYAYESISMAYKEMKNYKGAYEYANLFNEIKDSINSVESRNLMSELRTKYETENKEKEIVLLNKEKDLKNIELKNSRSILIFTVAGLAIISLFLILLFFSYKQKKRVNAEINHKNKKLEIAYSIVEEKNKEILDSITYAKRIQSAILPQPKLVKEYFPDSFILYKPKDIVAGDFYWLETVDIPNSQSTVLFAAADCTGHGVPGAMVSVICNNGLNRSVHEHEIYEPGKILDKTTETVIKEFEKSTDEVNDGMDISLACLNYPKTINGKSNKDSIPNLSWAGANNPLLLIRDNKIIEYKPDKQPIGKYDKSKPFTTHQIKLMKDDVIYMFTDGYQDQFGGPKGKKFKPAYLRKLLLEIHQKPMDEQMKDLNLTFEEWRGNLEQVDDVCVLGVRI